MNTMEIRYQRLHQAMQDREQEREQNRRGCPETEYPSGNGVRQEQAEQSAQAPPAVERKEREKIEAAEQQIDCREGRENAARTAIEREIDQWPGQCAEQLGTVGQRAGEDFDVGKA